MNRNLTSHLPLLALVVASAAGWSHAQQAPAIAAGDRVVVAVRTEVKSGERTLATVEAGTELPVLAVRDAWVLVRVQRDSETLRGWVLRTALRPTGLPQPPSSLGRPPQTVRLRFEETALAAAPEDMIALAMFSASPDGRRIAYSALEDSKVAVYVDGDRKAVYDDVRAGHPMFGPNSRRVAFVARRGKQWFVVADDQPGPPCDAVEQGHPLFSPDGRHLAYAATRDGRAVVVVDQAQSGAWDAIEPRSLAFSATGRRLAYAARRDGRWFVVLLDMDDHGAAHHTLSAPYEEVAPQGPVPSPVGDRFAYAAKRDGQWRIVLDGGQAAPPFDWVGKLAFSPGGKYLVVQVRDGGMPALMLIGSETRRLSDRRSEAFSDVVFSPDGSRIAWWARRGDRWSVVLADVRGAVVQRHGPYDGYLDGALAISRDGQRVAFAAVRAGKAIVVVDGREGAPCDGVLEGTPVFSPDGRRVAYAARRGKTWQLVVDGQPERAEYGLIKERSVAFTPDGNHVVAITSFGKTGTSMAIAVDGELSEDYLFPLDARLIFDGPTAFHTVAVRGKLVRAADGDYYRMLDGRFLSLDVQIHTDRNPEHKRGP